MDACPELILIEIFSFLLKKDVGRFRQLNKRIREIIIENRKYFDFPKIDIDILDRYNDETNEKTYGKKLYIAINTSRYIIDCSNVRKITVKNDSDQPLENVFLESFLKDKCGSNSLLNCIFKSFTKRRKQSLKSLMGHIFRLRDIDGFQICVRNPKVMKIITEAVKISRIAVYQVLMPISYPLFPGFLDFKLAVGSKKPPKYQNDYPALESIVDGLETFWSNLATAIEITSIFRLTVFTICQEDPVDSILTIAKEWRKLHFPPLLFLIHIVTDTWAPTDLRLEERSDITELFTVSQILPLEFLNYSDVDETSSIRFEDKETGNILQFNKNNARILKDNIRSLIVRINVYLQ